MPNWNQLLDEINAAGSMHDVVRRRYLSKVQKITGRNVIAFYSGWLQKGDVPGLSEGVSISDEDKNGLMTVVHEMDRSLGLDLILHTPGGRIAAVESIVDYLRSMFGTNVRAFVPQLAMSGGTMIACACRNIVMGKQSSLGPIDPQLGGKAAYAVVEEFNRAKNEVQQDPSSIPIWQAIIANYTPTIIGECEKAIAWSNEMTREWLESGMFGKDDDAGGTIDTIIEELSDHSLTKSHDRHLSIEKCKEIGLKIVELEETQKLQDAVLSLHHACMLTFEQTPAVKLIENHSGVAFIKLARTVRVATQPLAVQELSNRPIPASEDVIMQTVE